MSFDGNYTRTTFATGHSTINRPENAVQFIPDNSIEFGVSQSNANPFHDTVSNLGEGSIGFGATFSGPIEKPSNAIYTNNINQPTSLLKLFLGPLAPEFSKFFHHIPPFEALPSSPLDTSFYPISGYFEKKFNWGSDSSDQQLCARHVHPRISLLNACEQHTAIPINYIFDNLTKIEKLGEGSFGEVYTGNFVECSSNKFIYKLIPTGGRQPIQGQKQMSFQEVKQELVVSQLLNTLRGSSSANCTTAFCRLFRGRLLVGQYPESLMTAWHKWDKDNKSDWDVPNFPKDQHFLLLEFENVGKPMAEFVFNNAKTAYLALMQLTFALAASEQKLEFEHRDLHIGNILVQRTLNMSETFKINGIEYKIPTVGYKTSIIDFTFSRSRHAELGTIFTDLSKNKEQFRGYGSYQFEVYRIMKDLNNNKWSEYVPKSNVYWLDYVVKKMVVGKDIQYKNVTSKTHKKYIGKLKYYASIIKTFDSAFDYITKTNTEIYKSDS